MRLSTQHCSTCIIFCLVLTTSFTINNSRTNYSLRSDSFSFRVCCRLRVFMFMFVLYVLGIDHVSWTIIKVSFDKLRSQYTLSHAFTQHIHTPLEHTFVNTQRHTHGHSDTRTKHKHKHNVHPGWMLLTCFPFPPALAGLYPSDHGS